MTKWRKARAARHRLLLGLAAACSLVLYDIPGAAQQSRGVFRASTEEGVVYATVLDRSGNPVSNLTRDAFEVRVGGRSVPITTFSNEPQPITAVVIVGTSIHLADRFFQMRDATARLTDLLGPGDRLRIGSFGSEISLSPLLTGDRTVLKGIIAEEIWPLGGASPLYQAIDLSVRSLSEERRPAAVLVLGNGGISGTGNIVHEPLVDYDQLRRTLLAHRVMVYSMRFRGRWGNGSELSRLARETGGGDVEIQLQTDLSAVVERIAHEFRKQYLLAFTTTVEDDRVQKLEVRVPERRDLTVRAPRGFVGGSR